MNENKAHNLKNLVLGLTAVVTLLGVGQAADAADETIQTVPMVDLQRFMGKWYEIAKVPVASEQGCDCATGNYALQRDGSILMLNQCVEQDGSFRVRGNVAMGRDMDPTTHSKLKLKFAGPNVYGDYWIIDLGQLYDYAVVTVPTADRVWILSRTPDMAPELYSKIVNHLSGIGFDTAKLQKSKQSPDPACGSTTNQ